MNMFYISKEYSQYKHLSSINYSSSMSSSREEHMKEVAIMYKPDLIPN